MCQLKFSPFSIFGYVSDIGGLLRIAIEIISSVFLVVWVCWLRILRKMAWSCANHLYQMNGATRGKNMGWDGEEAWWPIAIKG